MQHTLLPLHYQVFLLIEAHNKDKMLRHRYRLPPQEFQFQ